MLQAIAIAASALQGLGAYQAYQGQKRASRDANKALQERNDFAQEQFELYESLYGGIEEKVTSYYNNLSPEARANMQEGEINKRIDSSLRNLEENLTKRGISFGGIEASLSNQSRFLGAEARAKARAEAPMRVAQEQAALLNTGRRDIGRNTQNQALSDNFNVASGIAQGASQNYNNALHSFTDNVANLGINYLSQRGSTTDKPKKPNDPLVNGQRTPENNPFSNQ